MFKKLISLIGLGEPRAEVDNIDQQIDINGLVKQIRDQEAKGKIPQGRQIFSTSYEGYSICLDREFTACYRISVFLDSHKIYGFRITKEELTDEELGSVLEQVFLFLANEPSVKTLPESELFQAHFFGNS